MNTKNIKQHLRKKLDEWLKSITDESLRSHLRTRCIITGGAIVSLLEGEEPHDYDVYFSDKETVKRVAQYYVDEFNTRMEAYKNRIGYPTKAFVLDGETVEQDVKEHVGWNWGSAMLKDIPPDRIKIIIRSDGVKEVEDEDDNEQTDVDYQQVIEDGDEIPESAIEKYTEKRDKKPYRVKFITSNAITLSDKIQLCIRFYGAPSVIHENFDFVHATNYWTSENNDLYLNPKALECIINKELVYQGSKYPVCSIVRLRKFLKRGWWINAGQIVKMAFQISQLDLTDPIVLEDQLASVDTLYFLQLIDTLKKQQREDEQFQVTNEYFISVIDKIFG